MRSLEFISERIQGICQGVGLETNTIASNANNGFVVVRVSTVCHRKVDFHDCGEILEGCDCAGEEGT